MANHISEQKIIIIQAIIFISLLLLLSAILEGCTDKCETTRQYTFFEPVFTTSDEVRAAFGFRESRTIINPGKIYYIDGILFINEVGQGIHVIDNRDKKAPKQVGFINIPGNFELAAKGDIIYADSYIDLLAIDISDFNNMKVIKRVENIFPNYNTFGNFNFTGDENAILMEWKETEVTETFDSNCESGFPDFVQQENLVGFAMDGTSFNKGGAVSPSAPTAGIGGSMARFTVAQDHLYAINQSHLQVFNIANIEDPVAGNSIEIGWGIETIFPYQDKLFVGAQNGMHILDNSQPERPVLASTYAHVNSCDPVVVQDDVAFVTLRSGNVCQGFTNQLDVLNVGNIKKPELLISYPMQNPHGLGINGSTLFISEGAYGLKIFDASDIFKIDQQLLAHFQGIDAFDVIALDECVMVIGEDGLYQYDYSNPEQIKLLSTVPIVRK